MVDRRLVRRLIILKELFEGVLNSAGGSRMFSVVSKTWNPVTGCLHGCVYCWARRLAETKLRTARRYRMGFVPRLNEEEFLEWARRIFPIGQLKGHLILL